jgi:hypothetical protein
MARNVSCPVCSYEGPVWGHQCTELLPSVLASSDPMRLLSEEVAQLRADLARATKELEKERAAHAKTLAELERRTAWFNEQMREQQR